MERGGVCVEKIRVGVFGAFRGGVMAKALAAHPDAELVAVCDQHQPALEEVAKLAYKKGLTVALYENFEDFFRHDMDAVILANYANEHAPYAVRLLDSGRHVLSEVMPFETMAQAVALIEAVERSGRVYAYGENFCYMKGPMEMRRRYEAGELGEVQYAEGEYVHDLISLWPHITYGDRHHWRNRIFPTFYCSHSLGPMITITGRRPVQVVGFETNYNNRLYNLERGAVRVPMWACGALEMVTMDNGAVFKSLHNGLKRQPPSHNFQIYGTKGSMETDRFDSDNKLTAYTERTGDKACNGKLETYDPVRVLSVKEAEVFTGHGGSDFYPTHFFLQKILGREDGQKYSIDVYTAADIGSCGILAYRSILGGNIPMRVPDLRDKRQREPYRHDHACTNPAVAGDQLLPVSPQYDVDSIPDEDFEQIRRLWLERRDLE